MSGRKGGEGGCYLLWPHPTAAPVRRAVLTRVSVRGTLHVFAILLRNPAWGPSQKASEEPERANQDKIAPDHVYTRRNARATTKFHQTTYTNVACNARTTECAKNATARGPGITRGGHGMERARRDLHGEPPPRVGGRRCMCFPGGNPFVLPATRCALNYKRTLTVGGGNKRTLQRWWREKDAKSPVPRRERKPRKASGAASPQFHGR